MAPTIKRAINQRCDVYYILLDCTKEPGRASNEEGVVVTIDNARGFLSAMCADGAWHYTWADSTQWETDTFKEFLRARPAKWIAAKMMGTDFMQVDVEETGKYLLARALDEEKSIKEFCQSLTDLGMTAALLETLHTDAIKNHFKEELIDLVAVKLTRSAEVLYSVVIPHVQKMLDVKKEYLSLA